MKRAKYTEPTDFIPKDIRKEFKIGEFAENAEKKDKKERSISNEEFRNYVDGKKK